MLLLLCVGKLCDWRSRKQALVKRSSEEAEFRVMAQGICEEIRLKRMLDEIKIPINCTRMILCHNKVAIIIAKNPVHHDRTKHMEIDQHFIKEKIVHGIISVDHVPPCRQTLIFLTKAFPRNIYEKTRSNMV